MLGRVGMRDLSAHAEFDVRDLAGLDGRGRVDPGNVLFAFPVTALDQITDFHDNAPLFHILWCWRDYTMCARFIKKHSTKRPFLFTMESFSEHTKERRYL